MGSAVYSLWGLNEWLFLVVNQVHGGWWDRVMGLWSASGNFWNMPLVWLVLGVLVWLPPQHRPVGWHWPHPQAMARLLVLLVVGYGLAFMAVAPLKVGLHMPRPPQALGEDVVRVLGHAETSGSFPSGHATFAALMVATLWPLVSMGSRVCLVLWAVGVCVARMAVGAHFPADLLMGCLCGSGGAWAARLGLRHGAAYLRGARGA